MSTEHEGGLSGPDRPEPAAGDSVAPLPDAPDASVAAAEPPTDPTLSAYPPPIPEPPAAPGPAAAPAPADAAAPTSAPADASPRGSAPADVPVPASVPASADARVPADAFTPADAAASASAPTGASAPASASADAAVPAGAPVPAPVSADAPASAGAPAPFPADGPALADAPAPVAASSPARADAPVPAPAGSPAPADGSATAPASADGSAPASTEAPAPASADAFAPAVPAAAAASTVPLEKPGLPVPPPGAPAPAPPYAGYPTPGAQYPQYGQYQGTPYPAAPGYPGGGYPGAPFPGFPGAPAPRKRRRPGLATLLVVTALVAGGIGGGIGSWLETRDSSGGSTSVSASVNPKDLSRSPNSIAGIAARSLPSVVTISASNSQESGTGTGFIFDSRGYILTNNHVVAPSTSSGGKLSVTFSDGNSYPATIVGRAEGYDVAVIKLATKPKEALVPLPLGNSDAVQVGDTTIAIGAPFGLSGTVTSGIISAKNRPVASGDETGDEVSYMNALQTDASINPGNSGGPLMNASGQVIGIDSAIQSGGATDSEGQSGSVGLGFAIPINQAQYVAAQLIQTGQPIYPIIGILRDDSYTGDGAKIASGPVQGQPAVTPGGPAAAAGLKAGDVITEFAGVPIDSGPTLVSEIWTHHPGDKVSITYTRNGQSHTTTLVLGKRVGDSQ